MKIMNESFDFNHFLEVFKDYTDNGPNNLKATEVEKTMLLFTNSIISDLYLYLKLAEKIDNEKDVELKHLVSFILYNLEEKEMLTLIIGVLTFAMYFKEKGIFTKEFITSLEEAINAIIVLGSVYTEEDKENNEDNDFDYIVRGTN